MKKPVIVGRKSLIENWCQAFNTWWHYRDTRFVKYLRVREEQALDRLLRGVKVKP